MQALNNTNLASIKDSIIKGKSLSPFVILPMRLLKNQYRDILISAPHTIPQLRFGVKKVAEPETGVLARLLNEELGCPAIYSVPNEQGFCFEEYITAIHEYHRKFDLHFLIDLHQMKASRSELIDIGVGVNHENVIDKTQCIDLIQRAFVSRFGAKFVSVNKIFQAAQPYTVSKRISSECGIPCIQIEINTRLCANINSFCEVFESLIEIIKGLHEISMDFSFSAIKPQRIENISKGCLAISRFDANNKEFNYANEDDVFRVINSITENSFIINSANIKVDPQLNKGDIRVDARQRIFLGIDNPEFIPEKVWMSIINNLSQADKDILLRCYPSHDHVLSVSIGQNDREAIRKIVKEYVKPRIWLQKVSVNSASAPLTPIKLRNRIRSICTAIANRFIGRSSVMLMCRRPYKSDEGADIVRMAKASMSLLGIQEMDRVVLRYRSNSVSCPVLMIDDERCFVKENMPNEINLSIGVPAHIRNLLGIQDVKSCVHVERDTLFLLKKNLSSQIIPFLLTIAVGFFAIGVMPLWVALIFFVGVIAPVIAYFNFSQIRSMRGRAE